MRVHIIHAGMKYGEYKERYPSEKLVAFCIILIETIVGVTSFFSKGSYAESFPAIQHGIALNPLVEFPLNAFVLTKAKFIRNNLQNYRI